MASVVITETGGANVGGAFQLVAEPIRYVLSNWYIFVIGVLLCIALGIIIYLVFATKEFSKQRDEAGYFLYKKTIQDCINNRDVKKFSKTYSLKNLFLLGIPIFWKDKSKRILNKYGELIGRYRGHVRSQDGTYNLLVCTGTSFGIIDNTIIIKVPEIVSYEGTDEKGKSVKISQRFSLWVEDPYDKTITIKASGIERTAIFYYMPIVVEVDKTTGLEQVIDLRKFMEGSVTDSTYQVMMQRMLNSSQKQMEKAMLLNPHLKYDQMSPQKTAPEADLDSNVR